jgi:hypothetical protein
MASVFASGGVFTDQSKCYQFVVLLVYFTTNGNGSQRRFRRQNRIAHTVMRQRRISRGAPWACGIYDLRFFGFLVTWAAARPRDVYMQMRAD